MHPLSPSVKDINSSLINSNDENLTHILLFGKASLDKFHGYISKANTLVLNATINYIILTIILEETLFYCFVIFYFMFICSSFSTLFRNLMSFLRLFIYICVMPRFVFSCYFFTIFFPLYPGVSRIYQAPDDSIVLLCFCMQYSYIYIYIYIYYTAFTIRAKSQNDVIKTKF